PVQSSFIIGISRLGNPYKKVSRHIGMRIPILHVNCTGNNDHGRQNLPITTHSLNHSYQLPITRTADRQWTLWLSSNNPLVTSYTDSETGFVEIVRISIHNSLFI